MGCWFPVVLRDAPKDSPPLVWAPADGSCGGLVISRLLVDCPKCCVAHGVSGDQANRRRFPRARVRAHGCRRRNGRPGRACGDLRGARPGGRRAGIRGPRRRKPASDGGGHQRSHGGTRGNSRAGGSIVGACPPGSVVLAQPSPRCVSLAERSNPVECRTQHPSVRRRGTRNFGGAALRSEARVLSFWLPAQPQNQPPGRL
jgi:hypothetical protein